MPAPLNGYFALAAIVEADALLKGVHWAEGYVLEIERAALVRPFPWKIPRNNVMHSMAMRDIIWSINARWSFDPSGRTPNEYDSTAQRDR
jgi:hypothetical protein